MKAYGRKPQHPKGYPDIKVRGSGRPWWEAEGAQPEKGPARAEAKSEIRAQIQDLATQEPQS